MTTKQTFCRIGMVVVCESTITLMLQRRTPKPLRLFYILKVTL